MDVKNIPFFILWLKKKKGAESIFSFSGHTALGEGGACKSERAVTARTERRINKWKKLEYGVSICFLSIICI